MIIKVVALMMASLVLQTSTKCSDELSCFKTRLFNFGSAGESIYLLSHITDSTLESQLNIMAYGDFNNDLQYGCTYA